LTFAVGIDVGGSKIAAGVVDTAHGEVRRRLVMPTDAAEGGAAVLARCVELALELTGGEATPVGIGLCEVVDPRGAPSTAATVDWRELDVARAFGGIGAVGIESDVRAAARAEALFGAGLGVTPFIYVTVGTGISSCLVVHGAPVVGARGAAIILGAPPVEEIASGRALAARAGTATAEEVLADPRHDELVASAAAQLGCVVAVLANALDPALVVVGGGLGLADRYRALVAETIHRTADVGDVPVVPAGLGADAGIVGAALVAPR
jgi:glucokinase